MTTQQQYSNELVSFTVNSKPSSVVELALEASPDLVRSAYHAAIKVVTKQVVLPGFRKGRAPEALVAKNYPQEVNTQWQEEIVLHALRECQKISQITPLQKDSKVHFHVKSHSKEEGASLTVGFEVEPTIPSINPATCTLKEVKRPEVNESKVKETLRQILFFFAHWQPIEGRAAQEDDLVVLDVDIIETEPAQPLFSQTRFEVSDKSMAQWMKPLVIGLNPGESIEGVSFPDDTLPEEEKKAFQPKKVRISLKKIEQATLPTLDDAFAKNLGVETVDEVHTQIEKILNAKADAHVKEALRSQVNEFLLSEYKFDIPMSLIEKETRFRFQQLQRDPEFKQHWDSLSEELRRNLVDNLYAQSEKAVRIFFLSRKVLHDAQLSVSGQDVPVPATSILEMLLQPDFAREPAGDLQQAEAYSRLILEKAEDFIIAHANKA